MIIGRDIYHFHALLCVRVGDLHTKCMRFVIYSVLTKPTTAYTIRVQTVQSNH